MDQLSSQRKGEYKVGPTHETKYTKAHTLHVLVRLCECLPQDWPVYALRQHAPDWVCVYGLEQGRWPGERDTALAG